MNKFKPINIGEELSKASKEPNYLDIADTYVSQDLISELLAAKSKYNKELRLKKDHSQLPTEQKKKILEAIISKIEIKVNKQKLNDKIKVELSADESGVFLKLSLF